MPARRLHRGDASYRTRARVGLNRNRHVPVEARRQVAISGAPNVSAHVMGDDCSSIINKCVAAAADTVSALEVPVIELAVVSRAMIVCEPAASSVAVTVATPPENETAPKIALPNESTSV